MIRDASSLFVIFALLFVLLAGAAWVYSRYRPGCVQSAPTIGCGLTELPGGER